jgi:hypothetical protein
MLEPTPQDLLERARQIESEKQEARLHPSQPVGDLSATREAFDSFFNGIQGRLNGLLSQSKGDSVSISRRDLEAFVSWLSLIRQRAVLSVEEMPDLGPAEAAPDGAMPVN